MTREEAIKVLEMVECHGSLTQKAKEMAISALSAEGEYIKKEDVINQIANVEDYVSDGKVYICLGEAINNISSMQGYSFPDREKGEITHADVMAYCMPRHLYLISKSGLEQLNRGKMREWVYSDLLRVKHGTMNIDSLIDKVYADMRGKAE